MVTTIGHHSSARNSQATVCECHSGHTTLIAAVSAVHASIYTATCITTTCSRVCLHNPADASVTADIVRTGLSVSALTSCLPFCSTNDVGPDDKLLEVAAADIARYRKKLKGSSSHRSSSKRRQDRWLKQLKDLPGWLLYRSASRVRA